MAWGWGPSTRDTGTYMHLACNQDILSRPLHKGDRSDRSGRHCSNHHLRPVALLPARGQFPCGGAWHWHYGFVDTFHLGSSGVGLRFYRSPILENAFKSLDDFSICANSWIDTVCAQLPLPAIPFTRSHTSFDPEWHWIHTKSHCSSFYCYGRVQVEGNP